MGIRQVRVRDLPDELIDEFSAKIAPYSVAITRLEENDPRLFGSAVLAQHRGIHGLLTARHVIEVIRREPRFCLVLRAGSHRFAVELDHTTILKSETGLSEDSGPDIGFVCLPDYSLGQIRASNSFVSLEKHRERAASLDPSTGLWCLLGCPDERSSTNSIPGRIELTAFGLACVGPPPENHEDGEDFDYYEMIAQYSDSNDLPNSFGGVSGGGVWQARAEGCNGVYTIREVVLRGVAFHESRRLGNIRAIRCHGSKSLYHWLLRKIESECGA